MAIETVLCEDNPLPIDNYRVSIGFWILSLF